MPYPELDTERMELLYVLHPDNHLGNYLSPFIDVTNFHKLWVMWTVGDMAVNSTLQMRIYESQDGAGAGEKVIGKWPATLTAAAADGDSAVVVNLRSEEMDAANGYRWIRVLTLIQAAASHASCHIFGTLPRYAPVSIAAWTEVVP